MPTRIKAWQCAFCSRYRINKASITRHEEICFSNPNRKILSGEMAIWKTIPRDLTAIDSYGVDDSDWHEPIWDPGEVLSQKYKWWPRDKDGCVDLGYIFDGLEWVKMEGYEPPHFAPGYSWRDEVIPEKYYEMKHSLRYPSIQESKSNDVQLVDVF